MNLNKLNIKDIISSSANSQGALFISVILRCQSQIGRLEHPNSKK